MALQISERNLDGIMLLSLSGRVVLGDESTQLRARIKELIGAGKTRLLLDLGEVSYIDSAGLGTLVSGFTSAQNEGGTMKLVHLTKKFHEQLNITKLVTVFDVFDNVDEAVKSFK